jgi:hypothetical protein
MTSTHVLKGKTRQFVAPRQRIDAIVRAFGGVAEPSQKKAMMSQRGWTGSSTATRGTRIFLRLSAG